MSNKSPIRIATISDNPDPDWAWLRDLMPADLVIGGDKLAWTSFTMAASSGPKAIGRYHGAQALAKASIRTPFDLIVSHGPWVSAWTEWFGQRDRSRTKHLAYSFNFTDLPGGIRKPLMAAAFRKIDALAVFTEAEQALYADYFRIDPSKILRAPWGVAPPISAPVPLQITGDYYAALGGEARDYGLLCEVARRCPDLKFAAIARPHNFDGLDIPANLTVLFDLPLEQAWSIVWDAKAALIPLRSRETPCGLVTLVGGMHLGKAQIVTEAAGVSEYVQNGETGILVPAGDADAMAGAVRRLGGDPALSARLGAAAKAYAGAHCSEAATVGFFRSVLERWFD